MVLGLQPWLFRGFWGSGFYPKIREKAMVLGLKPWLFRGFLGSCQFYPKIREKAMVLSPNHGFFADFCAKKPNFAQNTANELTFKYIYIYIYIRKRG